VFHRLYSLWALGLCLLFPTFVSQPARLYQPIDNSQICYVTIISPNGITVFSIEGSDR